jgi:hypothetical protein
MPVVSFRRGSHDYNDAREAMNSRIQVFAVVRVDTDAEPSPGGTGPGIQTERFRGIAIREITVQSVLPTEEEAVKEVKRLNALNASKGATYFWMTTRYYPQGRNVETAEG